MTPKQIQKAIDAYNRTGNLKPLTRLLTTLVSYVAKEAYFGLEQTFIENLPGIADKLKSLDLSKSKHGK